VDVVEMSVNSLVPTQFIMYFHHGNFQTAIAPLYKEMSEEYDTVIFLKVDVDEDPDTAAKYSVSAMPTFLFVKGGKVIDRLQGANPQKLRSLVEEYM
jgi:thioredoxin 1